MPYDRQRNIYLLYLLYSIYIDYFLFSQQLQKICSKHIGVSLSQTGWSRNCQVSTGYYRCNFPSHWFIDIENTKFLSFNKLETQLNSKFSFIHTRQCEIFRYSFDIQPDYRYMIYWPLIFYHKSTEFNTIIILYLIINTVRYQYKYIMSHPFVLKIQ